MPESQPSLVVWHEADKGTQEWIRKCQVLDCGHGHLGNFRICIRCQKTRCLKCWLKCNDQVIADFLKAVVRTRAYRPRTDMAWVNTCKTCKDKNPNSYCPQDCPGRLKFTEQIEGVLMPERIARADQRAWLCDCPTCLRKRTAHTEGRAIDREACQARRGYYVEGDRAPSVFLNMTFADKRMCKDCFAQMFYTIQPLPKKISQAEETPRYKVVFRASANCWKETKNCDAPPPHMYLQTIADGREASMVEWACCHIGKHNLCHGQGQGCQMISTSVLMSEAIRRMTDEWWLQIICIPSQNWHSCTVDMSNKEAMDNQSNIDKHLRAHGIGRDDIEGFAFRFREVVIDRRAVKDGSLDELVFELGNSDPLVVDLRDICYRVQQMLHVDGLSFLEAEHECRSRVNRVFGGIL